MTTTVRSVRVELELGIDRYVANARTAGRETDAAFDRVEARVTAADRAVGGLEKSTAGLSKTSAQARTSQAGLSREIDKTGTSAARAEKSIDKYSGRLGLILKLSAGIGPALVPIGAVGIPAVAGLVSQLGFAAAAGGSAVLAFQGVGDSLKAIEKARLEPTVENLQAADEAMRRLAPDAQTLVHHLEDLAGAGRGLQRTAAGGFLPGVDDSLTALENRIPDVRRLIKEVSDAAGDEVRDAGESLASSRWDFFFEYLRTQARPQLDGLADSVGNLVHGFARLVSATTPLQSDFTGWLRESTEDFDDWATRLDSNTSFQQFVAYVRENGPQVEATASSIADAILQIVEAAAPLGGPTLQVLESVADIIGSIADSDVGTPLLTLLSLTSAYSLVAGRVKAVNETAWGGRQVSNLKGFASALTTVTTAQDRARISATQLVAAERAGNTIAQQKDRALKAGLGTIAKGAALAGIFGLAASGVADKVGLANTATLGLAGSMAGPWGAAVGAGVGLLLDWSHRSDGAKESAAEFTGTLDQQTGALTDNSRALAVKKLQDSGALDAAKDLGVNLQLVTDAALGNEQAQKQLNTALAAYSAEASTVAGGGKGSFVAGAYSDDANAASLLGDAVSSVSDAVGASQQSFDDQSQAMAGTTKQTNTLRAAYDSAASAADGLVEELSALDDFLNNRGTFRAYQASLDALRDSLKDAPHAFSALGEAGRTNLGNLDEIVSDAARHVEGLNDAFGRPDTKARATFLDAVIANLRQIGKTSPEAAAAVRDVLPPLRELREANDVGEVKLDNADALKKAAITRLALRDLALEHPRPTITADDGPATRTIKGTKGLLSALDATVASPRVSVNPGNSFSILGGIRSELSKIVSKTINVTVNRIGGALQGFASADGGTVPGPRSPYGDKVLAHLAPGEEVISNRSGQADRFRADRASGRIPAYADGGTVSRGLNDPLFTGEGPRYYKAAYRHNRPFAIDGPSHWDWPYQSGLTPAQARAFEAWIVSNGVPFDPDARIVDYDMRGYWAKTKGRGWKPGDHFPDTFKTPYDTTFSHESKYATSDNPFYWHGDKLIDVRTGQVVFGSGSGRRGFTGRGGRDDVAGVVHRGEFVVDAKDTARDREMLEARYGQLRGYADGGSVGDRIASTHTSRSDPFWNPGGGPLWMSDLADSANDATRGLKGLEKAATKVEKSYDKQKAKLDDLISQRDSTASSIASAALHDPFGNGLAGFDAQVDADSGDLTAMSAALATLVKNGLDPKSALYQQLAAHMDLTTAQQLAQLSSTDLASRSQRFDAVQSQASAFGQGVAGEQFNEAIRDSTKATNKLEHRLEQLQDAIHDLKDLPKQTGDAVYHGTKDGSHDGTWEGTRDAAEGRQRRTSTTRRTGGGSR